MIIFDFKEIRKTIIICSFFFSAIFNLSKRLWRERYSSDTNTYHVQQRKKGKRNRHRQQ